MPRILTILASGALLFGTNVSWATEYLLPLAGSVVGTPRTVIAGATETLLDIAHTHDLGYEELKLANPGVDTWLPGHGQRIVLPTQFILPDAPRSGVVLNLAEMRLYYYPRARRLEDMVVITHPVSIGRYDWETPLGTTRIVSKVTDPAWYPPKSIRAEHEAAGDPLPAVVPPGPDNPLGAHALALGKPGYLIHGTNKPFGIGMRVSHGCIRMYPHDIAKLFERIPVGTPVHIINQPIKVGWDELGKLYVEAHPKEGEHEMRLADGVRLDELVPQVSRLAGTSPKEIDWESLKSAVASKSGIPTSILRSERAVRLAGLSMRLRQAPIVPDTVGQTNQPSRLAKGQALKLRLTY